MRFLMLTMVLLAGVALPAAAQQAPSGIGPRVSKLEREMRAVQRKVFPGGSQQYFEPEIAPAPAAPAAGVPASPPIADLTARVGSLEQELTRLTGQVEQNSFKLRQLEEQLTRFRSDAELRINALEGNGAAPAPTSAPPSGAPLVAPPAPAAEPTAPSPGPSTPAARSSAPTRAPSGDPAEDGYLAGYDLWLAKKYGEAATTLRAVVTKYPNHRRASFAQNLLGRALLDDGQPAKAAEAFYASYQKMPRGERAPDSLYYLGQALMSLKPAKAADACKVYAELLDVYGEKIDQTLKNRVAKGRADANCMG